MKLALFAHSPTYYGASRSLVSLVDGLANFEVKPYVIVPENGALTRALSKRGVPFTIVPHIRWFQPRDHCQNDPVYCDRSRNLKLLDPGYLFSFRRRIIQQLQAWRPDVIYTNSVVLQEGALAARMLKLPHVWHLREFGDLDYDRLPVVGWPRAKAFIAGSHATISVSESVRRHFFSPHDPGRDFVVYNGVASSRVFGDLFRKREQKDRRGYNSKPFTFALVGKLIPAKGQAIAIHALKHLISTGRQARLILAGGGESDALRRLAQELGVSGSVTFKGFVQNPFSIFLEADASLMCSRSEAFGRVTAEAMATGLPVIGHSTGGTQEIIEHEHNGLLYHGGPEALAACMKRLVDNPSWARQLGAAGWSWAHERYSVECHATGVLEVLQQVAAQGQHPLRLHPAV